MEVVTGEWIDLFSLLNIKEFCCWMVLQEDWRGDLHMSDEAQGIAYMHATRA